MDSDEEFALEDGGPYPQLNKIKLCPKNKPSFFTLEEHLINYIEEQRALGKMPPRRRYANG